MFDFTMTPLLHSELQQGAHMFLNQNDDLWNMIFYIQLSDN